MSYDNKGIIISAKERKLRFEISFQFLALMSNLYTIQYNIRILIEYSIRVNKIRKIKDFKSIFNHPTLSNFYVKCLFILRCFNIFIEYLIRKKIILKIFFGIIFEIIFNHPLKSILYYRRKNNQVESIILRLCTSIYAKRMKVSRERKLRFVYIRNKVS